MKNFGMKSDSFIPIWMKVYLTQNMLARSYTAACHEGVSTLRATSEETENPLINATLIRPEAREAGEQLALILVIVCRPAALDQVINASPGEILLARRLRCRRSGPRLHSAGVPLGLLNFDFSGGLLARMEALERELAQYVRPSGDQVRDGMCIAVVMQRLEESSLAQHLLLNRARLTTWANVRAEWNNVRRAQQIVSASALPMDIGAHLFCVRFLFILFHICVYRFCSVCFFTYTTTDTHNKQTSKCTCTKLNEQVMREISTFHLSHGTYHRFWCSHCTFDEWSSILQSSDQCYLTQSLKASLRKKSISGRNCGWKRTRVCATSGQRSTRSGRRNLGRVRTGHFRDKIVLCVMTNHWRSTLSYYVASSKQFLVPCGCGLVSMSPVCSRSLL